MKAHDTKRYSDQAEHAAKRYSAHYDNLLFLCAVEGKSVAYGNALIDDALALCGDPSYAVSHRNWGYYASAFLNKF